MCVRDLRSAPPWAADPLPLRSSRRLWRARAAASPCTVEPRKELKPYADGSVRRHYWCVKSIGGCRKTSIDQRALDKAISVLAIEILSDPRNTAAIETAAAEIASEAARLDLEIAEAEAVAEAIADRLGRGELPLTRYDVAVRPLDIRIAKLKAERAALPTPGSAPVPQQPLEASREQWQLRWDKADDKERRDLLKMALRGRHLVIAPVEHGAGGVNQPEIIRRIKIKSGRLHAVGSSLMAASGRAASRATAITSVSVNGGSVAAGCGRPMRGGLAERADGVWRACSLAGRSSPRWCGDGAGGKGRFLSFLVLVRTVRRSRDLRWSCVDPPFARAGLAKQVRGGLAGHAAAKPGAQRTSTGTPPPRCRR